MREALCGENISWEGRRAERVEDNAPMGVCGGRSHLGEMARPALRVIAWSSRGLPGEGPRRMGGTFPIPEAGKG
jgi:hypothetical protein